MKIISKKSKKVVFRKIQHIYKLLSLLYVETNRRELKRYRNLIIRCLYDLEDIILKLGDDYDMSKLYLSSIRFLHSKESNITNVVKNSTDIQDVVRCKNCKQFKCIESSKYKLSFDGYCMRNCEPRAHKFDDFCNYGEEINNYKSN